MLKGKNILLGVTGGIAAYKAADLCSRLVKQHAGVDVIMTENATQFITPLTFESLCHRRTVTDTFDRNHPWEVEHIALAEKADCVVIAPATANIIAKLSYGLADDMLTTTVLACTCPKILVPAMNTHMYENPVTQDNLERLRRYGWHILEPAIGHLACGTSGKGKMPEPETILQHVLLQCACEKDLQGQRILVTAGPTREAVDPVRFLTNHSSGKMGYAIAQAAACRGAKVTLVSGQVSIPKPEGVDFVSVTSAQEMYEAVTGRQQENDIIIKAAAVADYRPAKVADQKIKKKEDSSDLIMELERTGDILQYLGEHKPAGQLLCGFSMETEHMLENSRKKLEKKHLDMIAANNVKVEGAGFGVDTNVLTLITKDSEKELPLLSKHQAAMALLDALLEIKNTSRQISVTQTASGHKLETDLTEVICPD